MENSKRRPLPLSEAEQRKVLSQTLDLLFKKDRKGAILDLQSKTDVMQCLADRGIKYFNSEAGNAVSIGKDNIGDLIRLACNRIGLSAVIGTKTSLSSRKELLKSVFCLKQLDVLVRPATEGNIAHNLGKIGAAMFNKVLNEHIGPPIIAIGGGQTMHQMMWWLNPPSKELRIIPTNYATRIPDKEVYDSSYLAMHVHWLCNQSTAQIISLPPLPTQDPTEAALWHSSIYNKNPDLQRTFRDSLDPDIVFLGAGNFDHRSLSISRVYKYLGIDYLALKEMSPPPVGDINLCFYDKNGEDITSAILSQHLEETNRELSKKLHSGSFFPNEPYCHPFLVGLNMAGFKRLVAMGKTVIVVAGGEGSKAEAIYALLKAHVINGLVTDIETMDRLLDLHNQESGTTQSPEQN